MIELRGVSKTVESGGRPLTILNPLDLVVPAGQLLAVVGPSGSGKSTLLGLVAGLDEPSTGTILIDGVDITALTEDRLAELRGAKIGFVFQFFHLMPSLSAFENVLVPLEIARASDPARKARKLLEEVGLTDRAHHYPSQLSGGEQQRVCVARALINQPELILADEPTGNLDEVNEALILSLLAELQRKGITIIMVTHDPEVGRLADRRIELHHGKLSEVSFFPLLEEELFDHLLKRVWILQEDTAIRDLQLWQLPELRDDRATLARMAEGGWITSDQATAALTEKGRRRASEIIRRHRLAERLFHDTCGLPEELLDANACKIEHTLSAEVTEKICTFLNHPLTCPHGAPIPRGACCANGQ